MNQHGTKMMIPERWSGADSDWWIALAARGFLLALVLTALGSAAWGILALQFR